MRKHPWRSILWLILAGLLLLQGCAPAPEEGRVSFMVFGEPAELAAYQSLVAAFHTAHPEIQIALRHVPDQGDYRRKLAVDFSAGAPPDVMLLNYRRFAQVAEGGGLMPLDAYVAESDLIRPEDFYPQAFNAFMYEGQLWCIAQNISSLILYYNKDLFDQAGLAYPTADWRWDDFLSAARILTRDLDEDGQTDQYGAGIAPSLFRLAPFIWQNGGTLVDDPVNPTRLTLDAPQSLAALTWFVGLQVQEGVVPDAAAETAQDSESRFLNGTLAMFFNSRRGVPTYRTITAFSWDVAPLPHSAQPASILHADGYCMAARAADPASAWVFIEFANSAAGQEIITSTGRTVPSLVSVANSPHFLDPGKAPASSQVFLDVIPTLGMVPVLPGWVPVEERTAREIARAFYGHADIPEILWAIETLTRPYFTEE